MSGHCLSGFAFFLVLLVQGFELVSPHIRESLRFIGAEQRPERKVIRRC